MFAKANNRKFQYLKKQKSRIPIFGNPHTLNSNVRKSENRDAQCFKKLKIEISNVWKSENREFQCLKKAKIENSNV